MWCAGNCASCGSSSSCASAEIAEPTGCTGNCATCGGCSSSSDTLDLGELALMFELMETPFLPVCRFTMTKAGEEDTVRMTALAPVYFNAVDTTMEEAKQIGEALLHLEDKGIIKKVLKILGRIICSIKIGTLARLLWIKCDKSIKDMRVLDYAAELVHGAFSGNQTFREGTPEGDVLLRLLRRFRFVLNKIDIKGWDGKKADLYDIIKNSAGNYGIDDYNATLDLGAMNSSK